ncbi:MAG: ABC transporter permease subunit [Opitutales bacterium]|nr:ABC transporter permease subunit [Opitutales bacterium]MCH8540745.1 ABC transporter permease subunit [Opitutales bacterium]
MRKYLILLKAELRNLYFSPATYIAAFLFVILMGLLFQYAVNTFVQSTQEVPPWVLFFQASFWVPVCFMVPLLTMRSLAEEKKLGTLESILSTPVSPGQLVGAKFTAAYLFYILLWAFTLGFNALLYQMAPSENLWESGPIIGGILFTLFSGLFFVSLGVLTSALTRSQLVAGIFSFTFLFLIIFGTWFLARLPMTGVDLEGNLLTVIEYVNIFQHAEDFGQGVIDSRPLVLYASGALLFLSLSILAVESKFWRA